MTAAPMRAGRTDPAFHYRDALRRLNEHRALYLIGGTYAYHAYARIHRPTKDLDIFVKAEDRDQVLDILREGGWETTIDVPHWLAKARRGDTLIDVIHGSGNGIATVDDLWFVHAVPGHVLGSTVRLVPVEEMIWSKSFVMEKYRFDGADVAHLLLLQGQHLDWDRLLWRFGRNWRVLLGHLLFFGFIYPDRRSLVPKPLMDTLLQLLQIEGEECVEPTRDTATPACRGTLLSRKQYRVDVEVWGFHDARLDPDVRMTERDIVEWTLANPGEAAALAEA